MGIWCCEGEVRATLTINCTYRINGYVVIYPLFIQEITWKNRWCVCWGGYYRQSHPFVPSIHQYIATYIFCISPTLQPQYSPPPPQVSLPLSPAWKELPKRRIHGYVVILIQFVPTKSPEKSWWVRFFVKPGGMHVLNHMLHIQGRIC
jgi:hypothetical protein